MSTPKITLKPYLFFYGNCEEALNTYAKILNGKVEVVNRYDNPAMNAPKDYQNKVLHASLEFGGNSLYACDSFPGQAPEKGSNVSLTIETEDRDAAARIFDKLAEGGQVHFPFEKQFWGAWHGSLTDKFGIKWNVNG